MARRLRELSAVRLACRFKAGSSSCRSAWTRTRVQPTWISSTGRWPRACWHQAAIAVSWFTAGCSIGSCGYELGIFDQDGRNARTRNPERVSGGRTLAVRVVAQPFRSSKSIAADLQAGLAFTSSDVGMGLRSLRGLTTFEETFFDPDLWVQGRRQRTGFELRWRPGPFSFKSEYIRVTTERRGQSVEDTDLSPLLATGWYVSGTWAITGEKKAAGLNKPRRPFMRGGLGAFETAVRFERLAFGSLGTDGIASFSVRADVLETASDHATTIGGSWYLNQWVKIQLNAVREAVTSPRRGQPSSSRAGWFYVTRFQFTM